VDKPPCPLPGFGLPLGNLPPYLLLRVQPRSGDVPLILACTCRVHPKVLQDGDDEGFVVIGCRELLRAQRTLQNQRGKAQKTQARLRVCWPS